MIFGVAKKINICLATLAIFASVAAVQPAFGAEGELSLETQGIFWAGGEVVSRTQSGFVDNKILRDHLYVEYFIPKNRRPNAAPIVLTHTFVSGVIWRTTPDGREGWAEYLVRQGFPVFVIDPPGTGRSGLDVDEINSVAVGQAKPMASPPIVRSDSASWSRWGMGAAMGQGHKDGQTPLDEASQRHFLGSLMPHQNISNETSDASFIAALEKINEMEGPAIFVGWSLAGGLGQRMAIKRPELFSGLVLLEAYSGQPPLPTPEDWFDYCHLKPSDAIFSTLAKTRLPVLALNGEMGHAVNVGHTAMVCKTLVDEVNAAGGNATSIWLPDLGITGNGHMMFWDKNSDQIADVIVDWIEKANMGAQK